MEHPLIGDLSQLKDEDLQEKISELTAKLLTAHRLGNPQMIGQLTMALESYKAQQQSRLQKPYGDSDVTGKIDIS